MSAPVLPSVATARDSGGHNVSLTSDRAVSLLVACSTARRASELHAAVLRAGLLDNDREIGRAHV